MPELRIEVANAAVSVDAGLAQAEALGFDVALASSKDDGGCLWQAWIYQACIGDEPLAEVEHRDAGRALQLAIEAAVQRRAALTEPASGGRA